MAFKHNSVRALLQQQVVPVRMRVRKPADSFEAWHESLVTDSAIMGGAAVFPNSRLCVSHVGQMFKRGASMAEIIEDYPYLNEQDIRFAGMYVDIE